MGKPVILPELRRARQLTYGQRNVSMLRPICADCQGADNAPSNWYEECPHDPYVGVREIRRQEPVYEDVLDTAGKPTGEKIVTGLEDRVKFTPEPNWVEVTVSTRVNSGLGEQKARAKGYIRPSELVSPAYPDGIAETCEFRGCRWQQGLKGYIITAGEDGTQSVATLCRDLEAKLIAWDERSSGALEIGHDPQSRAKRRIQLDQAMPQVVNA